MKRVKRISSSNRTGKFVSSEFSYEDLGSEEVADNDHIWLEDAACEHDASLTCAAVESRPKNKRSGYSRRVSFIDLDEYRVHRIDFYNRRGDLEKSLRFEDYRQYEGQFWRAHVMIMDNSQTGKSTRLSWGDYSFRQGLTERDFTPQGTSQGQPMTPTELPPAGAIAGLSSPHYLPLPAAAEIGVEHAARSLLEASWYPRKAAYAGQKDSFLHLEAKPELCHLR